MSTQDERDAALDRVRAWSIQLHGPSPRHDWCMATARAMQADTELPHPRGYAKRNFGTGISRRATIRKLLGDTVRKSLLA